MSPVVLAPESVDAVARRVVELQREESVLQSNTNPWLTREQAAKYLNLPLRTFDRTRQESGEALKPCSEHPLRWSKMGLDAFKFSRGPSLVRPGRKPTLRRVSA